MKPKVDVKLDEYTGSPYIVCSNCNSRVNLDVDLTPQKKYNSSSSEHHVSLDDLLHITEEE